jgi:hypothetical protein
MPGHPFFSFTAINLFEIEYTKDQIAGSWSLQTFGLSIFAYAKKLVGIISVGIPYAITRIAAEIFWKALNPKVPAAFLRRVKYRQLASQARTIFTNNCRRIWNLLRKRDGGYVGTSEKYSRIKVACPRARFHGMQRRLTTDPSRIFIHNRFCKFFMATMTIVWRLLNVDENVLQVGFLVGGRRFIEHKLLARAQ